MGMRLLLRASMTVGLSFIRCTMQTFNRTASSSREASSLRTTRSLKAGSSSRGMGKTLLIFCRQHLPKPRSCKNGRICGTLERLWKANLLWHRHLHHLFQAVLPSLPPHPYFRLNRLLSRARRATLACLLRTQSHIIVTSALIPSFHRPVEKNSRLATRDSVALRVTMTYAWSVTALRPRARGR